MVDSLGKSLLLLAVLRDKETVTRHDDRVVSSFASWMFPRRVQPFVVGYLCLVRQCAVDDPKVCAVRPQCQVYRPQRESL